MSDSPSPSETLPGLLPGRRVRISGGDSTSGRIIATGHRYGPGGGHDQACVRFIRLSAADHSNPHPIRRKARLDASESWYYLDSLEFAP